MAKETTTVQCYPSDSAVNRKIREYEAFGWELINNQRCNEDKGTYGGYRHYSTFNKLSRAKKARRGTRKLPSLKSCTIG